MATTLPNPSGAVASIRKDANSAAPLYVYANITTDTTTTVKTGAGVLHAITLNAPTATEVITIYDGLSSSGTKIGTITVPSSPQPATLFYDVEFTVGLTIVTGTATSDITISFN